MKVFFCSKAGDFLSGLLFVSLFAVSTASVHAEKAKSDFIGTNFWFLAPGWSGEHPFKENIPSNPYTNQFDIWNPVFLEEISFYSCLRFMDWGATNNYTGTSWEDRRQPDDPQHFVEIPVGTRDVPGMAYEWMVDLCNRVDADLWICLPTRVDDAYVEELAKLIREKLDPRLKVFVEYSNEVWNFQKPQRWCKARGVEMGLSNDYEGAMRYQVFRSAEIWKIFEEVFAGDTARIINVLAGKSTSPWTTENLHLSAAFDPSFNTPGVKPEAYAIAPYFGGNGLKGDDPEIWRKLRQDIFEKRPQGSRGAGQDSRLQNVKDQHAVVVGDYGLHLIAYEGGQHVHHRATAPNRDPEMYDVYIEYLNGIAPYLSQFAHYTHVGSFGDGGCWGAKEYTGQPESEAHKYHALKDWVAEYEDEAIAAGRALRERVTPEAPVRR